MDRQVVRAEGILGWDLFPRTGKLGNADVGAIAGVVKAVHTFWRHAFFWLKSWTVPKLEPCEVNAFAQKHPMNPRILSKGASSKEQLLNYGLYNWCSGLSSSTAISRAWVLSFELSYFAREWRNGAFSGRCSEFAPALHQPVSQQSSYPLIGTVIPLFGCFGIFHSVNHVFDTRQRKQLGISAMSCLELSKLHHAGNAKFV